MGLQLNRIENFQLSYQHVFGSKGGKGLGKEGANRHGKVLQCGCIKEDTMPVISGLAHQDGINGLNQGPCAFIRACIADAKVN